MPAQCIQSFNLRRHQWAHRSGHMTPYPQAMDIFCCSDVMPPWEGFEVQLYLVTHDRDLSSHILLQSFTSPFFTSFSSPLPNFLTLASHFTRSHPTTKQQNMIVLVQSPFSYFASSGADTYVITKCQLCWLLHCEHWVIIPGVLNNKISIKAGWYIDVWGYKNPTKAGCYIDVGWDTGSTSPV